MSNSGLSPLCDARRARSVSRQGRVPAARQAAISPARALSQLSSWALARSFTVNRPASWATHVSHTVSQPCGDVRTGTEVVPVNPVEQRTRLGLEGANDRAIMDHMDGALIGLMGLAGHRQTMIRTQVERDMIGMNPRGSLMTHQSGGDRSEDPPPRDATGGGHPHTHVFRLFTAPCGQHLEMLNLGCDRLVMAGIDPTDEISNDRPSGIQIGKIAGAAQSQRIRDLALEMTVGALNRPVV